MKLSSKKIKIISIVFLFLIIIIFNLPRHSCCDEFDPEYENLIRNGFLGDLDSLRKLYDKSIQEGIEPDQETWSRLGAQAGDPCFRKIYLDIVINKKSLERQKKIMEDIKKDVNKYPGAATLLIELQIKIPQSK